MRRLSAAFLLALAACTSPSVPPPEPAPGSIRARFLPDSAQDVIEVTMRDRMAARTVALVGPGGIIEPAYAIDTQPARRSARVYGGLSPAASPFGIAGAPSTTTVTDETATTAFVRVPDVFHYRQNWQAYRIRIEIGTPPDGLRAVMVPAPPPPA